MVPPRNLTVRFAPLEAAPGAAARAGALVSTAIIALTGGTDEQSVAQSPLNSRRLNSCLSVSTIYLIRFFGPVFPIGRMLNVHETYGISLGVCSQFRETKSMKLLLLIAIRSLGAAAIAALITSIFGWVSAVRALEVRQPEVGDHNET